jgi:hypothetical protein
MAGFCVGLPSKWSMENRHFGVYGLSDLGGARTQKFVDARSVIVGFPHCRLQKLVSNRPEPADALAQVDASRMLDFDARYRSAGVSACANTESPCNSAIARCRA